MKKKTFVFFVCFRNDVTKKGSSITSIKTHPEKEVHKAFINWLSQKKALAEKIMGKDTYIKNANIIR